MILSSDGLLLMLFAVVVGFAAQGYVNATYSRFSREPSASGMTGAMAARRILDANGLSSVAIQRVAGKLSDHYDPRTRVLSLSADVHDGASVAATGVAAHEAGHALQHATAYAPLAIRSTLVPGANIGSRLAPFLILIGLLINFSGLVWLGIALFAMAVVFQIVTLPVELDASSRAIAALAPAGVLAEQQLPGARAVLRAAALTYVAATLISILYLLYYTGFARRD